MLFVGLFVSVAPARAGYHLWFGQGGSPLEELTVGPGEVFSVQLLVSDDNPASVVTFTSVDAKLGNSSGALLPIGGVTGLGSFAGFTTLSQGGTLVSAF